MSVCVPHSVYQHGPWTGKGRVVAGPRSGRRPASSASAYAATVVDRGLPSKANQTRPRGVLEERTAPCCGGGLQQCLAHIAVGYHAALVERHCPVVCRAQTAGHPVPTRPPPDRVTARQWP
jgi:hypothetical protein